MPPETMRTAATLRGDHAISAPDSTGSPSTTGTPSIPMFIFARFDDLERNMRMIAETVALHARYHLTVVPPVPESQQREALLLGDEPFKVLAEQVDRRVREGRPLMQETIDRSSSSEHEELKRDTGVGPNLEPARKVPNTASERVDLEQTPPASVKAGRGNPSFTQHPKPTADGIKPAKLEAAPEKALSKWRLILSVFFPFAAGYYLSFLFRTINASISPVLASDFGLGAAETGLGLFPSLCRCPDPHRTPPGSLQSATGPERIVGYCRQGCDTFRQCR